MSEPGKLPGFVFKGDLYWAKGNNIFEALKFTTFSLFNETIVLSNFGINKT